VARYRLLALTVGPDVVFAARPQEAPTELGESLLEIAPLHPQECTPIGVRLFQRALSNSAQQRDAFARRIATANGTALDVVRRRSARIYD
jgi:hypothetical protein